MSWHFRDRFSTGSTPPPSAAAPVERKPAAFDPGAHTVAETLAYVDANPDQEAAVFAAEVEGKSRSTILDALGG